MNKCDNIDFSDVTRADLTRRRHQRKPPRVLHELTSILLKQEVRASYIYTRGGVLRPTYFLYPFQIKSSLEFHARIVLILCCQVKDVNVKFRAEAIK